MRYILLEIILFFFGVNIFAQENWFPVGPGGGSDLEAIAIQPDDPDIVYIGGDIEGVFKTTDGGISWKNINANLAGEYSAGVYYVQEIIFDPFDNSYQTLYLCTAIGLFVTTTGGENWKRLYPIEIQSEDDYLPVSYLTVDPDNENILWIGTGISHSDEEGTGSLLRSIDKGSSWEVIHTFQNDAVIHGILVDANTPQNNRSIFVSTSNGIYKSIDNGTSWISKNTGLPHTETKRLSGIYVNSNMQLFVSLNTHGSAGQPSSFNGGLYKSTNHGESWFSINGNLPTYQIDENAFYYYWKFSIDPTNPDVIYTATTRSMPEGGFGAYEEMGVYKTTNGGTNWEYISNNINYGWLDDIFGNELHAFVLEAAPSNPDIIYWGLVWMNKSTDAGNTWNQIYTNQIGNEWQTTGLEFMAVEGMTFDPVDENIVYISYDDFGPFKSTDGGLSFFHLDQVQDPYDGYDAAKDLIVDPGNNNHLYLSRYEGLAGAYESGFELGQVWFSSNAGVSWNNISNGLPDGRPDLIMDNNSGSPGNRILYCTVYNKGIYRSTNSGNSWIPINNGLLSDDVKVWVVNIDPNNSSNLFLGINNFGNGGGLYNSTNAGSDWQKISSFPSYDIMTIKIDAGGNIYVGATDNFDWNMSGGLFKSTDNGLTWIDILDYSRIADIEIDPSNNEIIYAVQQSWYVHPQNEPGVFVSNDAGLNWQSISTNLPHRFIRFIKINPRNPNQVFIGTNGGGVFMKDISVPVKEISREIPTEFYLYQNYPNPFNPKTNIKFRVPSFGFVHPGEPAARRVSLKVFDVLGRELATLVDEQKKAGFYKIEFDASTLSSGIYFYRLTAGELSAVKKFILIK